MGKVIQFPTKPIKFPDCLEHFKDEGGCRDGRNCDKVDPQCEMQWVMIPDPFVAFPIRKEEPKDAAND